MRTKDLESRVLELRGRQFSLPEIVRLTKAESTKQVQEILDKERNQSVQAYKNMDKTSETYQQVLIHVVRLLRSEYHLNYKEIAEELNENEYLIFDVIRRNPVSSGKTKGFVRGYFTREEKRMRNEDMLRLNREGKTLAEIGRIFFTSKQNVSQIFQDMGVKPLSDKEALAVGVEPPAYSIKEMELESKVKELQTKLLNTQKQYAMSKYHLNGIIQDLRIKNIKVLAQLIDSGQANEDIIKEYKLVHHTIMRTYNALVKTNGTDTAAFKKIDEVIPLLARINVKVKQYD